MKITQIRNATIIVDYGGTRFLLDPMLAAKGSFPAFAGTANERANPLVDLPLSLDTIVDVDAVIVTHTHRDHWDDAAARALPKHLPLFVQHEKDAARIRAEGFADVRVLAEGTTFGGVSLAKTPGQHGSDAAMRLIGERLGEVCGVVFRHPDERTLYVAGDTVWNRFVAESLRCHRPKVVVLNCGDARIDGCGSIIMGKEDVAAVCRAAPEALVIASHMDAVNHAMLSRQALRGFLRQTGLSDRVLVPEDGETCEA